MAGNCNCKGEAQNGIVSISGEHLAKLASSSSKSLFALSPKAQALAAGGIGLFAAGGGAGAGSLQTNFNVTSDGDVLSTTSFVDGTTGDAVVTGSIAGLQYELHINIAMQGDKITVTLNLTKPVAIGPYTLTYDLNGITTNAAGDIIHASGVSPSADFQPMGINWWCAAKCGGLTILPTLVICLPALAGGPPGYIACVTSKVGAADAATIAACIAKDCV